jgi:O-antigen/teichoic acid export membrane protein
VSVVTDPVFPSVLNLGIIARSRFVRQVSGTLSARAAIVILGLVASVVVARTLGPSGRGEYAVAVAVSAIAVQVSNLGLHTSSSWAAAQRPDLVGKLLANGVVASLTIGAIAIAAMSIAVILVPSLLPVPPGLFALVLVSIPVGLLYLVLVNLMLGIQRVRLYNGLELANRTLSVLVTAVMAAVGILTSFAAYAAVVGSAVAAALAGMVLVRRRYGGARPDKDLFVGLAGYGLRSYLASMFTLLLLRVDLVLVQYLLGSTQAGLYSIAVGLAEIVYLAPVVISTLLFPRLTAQRDDAVRWHEARRALVVVGAVAAVLALTAGVLGNSIVFVLYGPEFAESVPALYWLLPGIVFLSAHTVLMHYFYAVGTPTVAVAAPLAGWVLNLFLNVVLIPQVGIVGASLASSLAYGVVLVISLTWFARSRPRSGDTAAGALHLRRWARLVAPSAGHETPGRPE